MSELEIYKGMVKKMKDDELKEKKTKRIIEKIEGLATYVTIPRELAIYNVNIDSQEAKLLIDYITNLQHIEDLYNQLLKDYDELQQENEVLENEKDMFYKVSQERLNKWLSLNDENNKLVEIIKDYKSRCEKAVEYINENKHLSMFADCREPEEDWFYDLECSANELLNILNGKE